MKMCEIEKNQGFSVFNKDVLSELPKDELIKIVTKLQVHNEQLQNIIKKSSHSLTKSHRTQNPFDFSSCKFRHVLLKLFYAGWNYQGYASQEDTVNTIEHCLFEALQKTCLIKNRSSSNYHRCGRTDKGVSSYGQTISIDLRSKLNEDNFDDVDSEINYCKVLNKVLPKEIRCIAWCSVPNDFSARFDCESRTYKYYFSKGNLDIEKMKEGAQYLLGTHDFRNFCKMDVNNGVINFVRNVLHVDIVSYNQNIAENFPDEFSLYVFKIRGKAFLWHQIRCIMAILFLVGESRESPEIVKELLDIDKNPRKPEYNIAAENPLNLFECSYKETLNWIYDSDNVGTLYQHLYKSWTENAIKATMLKDMMENISKLPSGKTEQELRSGLSNDFLFCGVKSRKYKHLLARQKCESLENRMRHFSKKRKLEKTQKENDM